LLVEGGGTLLGSLFDRDLVDRIAAFIAPIVVGGVEAPLAVAGRGVERLVDARRAVEGEVRAVDGDLWFEGELRPLPSMEATADRDKGD
jgi:diaminohydroxyphosphoribosylaminopyrimidine deaminase/5-amino-6-(5-phosphoribosylamino)uracil reductase